MKAILLNNIIIYAAYGLYVLPKKTLKLIDILSFELVPNKSDFGYDNNSSIACNQKNSV